jgi:hypothetical protein
MCLFGLGLWCLTPLSAIFQLYHGGEFYWWLREQKYYSTYKALMSSSITDIKVPNKHGGSRVHDYIVPLLGFTTTYAIRAYHH